MDELQDERRLRELLRLWDSLHDDELGELATMPVSYLASDICGPHFNNWSLTRWRREFTRCGWAVAGTAVLPMALRLTMEHGNHHPLFPAGIGAVAECLDQARPAGFHRLMLRRAPKTGLDLAFDDRSGQRLRWSGLYSVRFLEAADRRTVKATFRSPTLRLRLDWALSPRQAAALRRLTEADDPPRDWMKRWARSEAARRLLWLWVGLGAIAVAP